VTIESNDARSMSSTHYNTQHKIYRCHIIVIAVVVMTEFREIEILTRLLKTVAFERAIITTGIYL